MARPRKYTVTITVPDCVDGNPLNDEIRKHLREELQKQALALCNPENLLRLYEDYYAKARRKAAEARKKYAQNTPKKKPKAADTVDNPPAQTSSEAGLAGAFPEDTVTRTGGGEGRSVSKLAAAASIALPPGKTGN